MTNVRIVDWFSRVGALSGLCLLWASTAAQAQTATLHLHREASTTSGLLQLKTEGPDYRSTVFTSVELKNLAAGEYVIKAFDTQAGVPNFLGLTLQGSTISFNLWMKKTANYATMYPRAKLHLNSATDTPFCTAMGTVALTTTLTKHTLTCTTSSTVAIARNDRLYLWVGVDMTVGPGGNRVKAEVDIEGTLDGNHDSTVVVPLPVLPTVTSVSPTSGEVGTVVTVTGERFGAIRGASTVAFNGAMGTPSSWSDTAIVVPVPSNVSLTTGLVIVTIDGKVPSNGLPFSLDLPPGVITSIAGNGTVAYSEGGPAPGTGIDAYDVAVDANGNVFIAATYLHRILKVAPNGTITTVAGTGSYPYGGDGGPATAAQLNAPRGVTVDNLGNVFIADSVNNRIRKVDTNGIITTVAGSGTEGYSGDGGPAVNAQLSWPTSVALDGQGGILISDSNNYRVRYVNAAGTVSTMAGTGTSGSGGDGGAATSAQFNKPMGIALDSQGNLFIADQFNSKVRKVDQAGIITTVAGNGLSGFGGDGGAATAANLRWPVGVAVDNAGNLFIGDTNNHRIRKVGPDGMIDTIVGNGTAGFGGDSGPATGAQLNYPHGLGADEQGNVLIADVTNHRVRKVAPPPAAPTISSLSPMSGPVGTVVVITGANFGSTQGTSTVSFNGTLAVPTSWSPTAIETTVPTGATTGPVVVTTSVPSNAVTFTVSPRIDSVSLASGPVGTSVTISGTNFGPSQGTSTVAFNGIVATPTSWNATAVAVPVPAGATSGPVVVTVSGIGSNGVSFTVTPRITSLSPTSGAVGTSVTITGTTFGAVQSTSTVTFNGIAATPTSWGATSIVVPVPAGATTGPVVVTVGSYASNGATFTVTPKIDNLSPTSGLVGTSVTINGTSFGVSQGTSTVTFNGAPATPTNWSDTALVVPVPTDATTGPVVVTVGGAASNGMSFTVIPQISNLSPTSGLVGASVTITGSGFGTTQGSGTVTFNGVTAAPTSWSATSIAVPVPTDATSGPVVVTVGGIASNSVSFTVTPQISDLFPTSGPVGTSVAINGTGFGGSQGASSVTFNGMAAAPTSWSATLIVLTVPAGATSGPVVVTVGGIASNGVAFTVTPQISGLSPTSGPVGTTVTISGTSFGATQGTNAVTFNGTTATPTNWSDTAIAVPVPSGATNGPVVVTVGGIASNGVAFTVTPKIDSLSPTAGSVGASVTISGTSFGATQGMSTVSFNGTSATPTSWSDTSIVVPVPTGATSSGPVVVTVDGFASNGVAFTVLSIQITYPTPGAILDQPDTVVMGQLAPGLGEVSVLVNGRPAMMNGQDFAINAVPLQVGTTVITATVRTLEGAEVSDSVSVNTTAQEAYVQITDPFEESLTPMTAKFTVDGVLPDPVTNVDVQITGPSYGSLSTTQFPFTTTAELTSIGIYLITATVTTAGGTYEGRMAVNVANPATIEALLQAKWDGMKAAAAVGDIEGALAYLVPDSQERYRSVFQSLGANLAPTLESVEAVHLLSLTNNEAEAESIRTEDGIAYSYPMILRRDMSGFWKFKGF